MSTWIKCMRCIHVFMVYEVNEWYQVSMSGILICNHHVCPCMSWMRCMKCLWCMRCMSGV